MTQQPHKVILCEVWTCQRDICPPTVCSCPQRAVLYSFEEIEWTAT